MGIRKTLQYGIDRAQFYFDVFPGLPYQPLPWLGFHKAKRGIGCNERWAEIEKSVSSHPISTALDIGCNVGFFTFSLAKHGIATIGVEMDDRFFRIAHHAANCQNIKNIGLLNIEINTDTVMLLPNVDLILLLSVWHHWVKYYGFESATKLLNMVWEKCNHLMYFETGENEMPPNFCLPHMTPTSKEWLTNYLEETCNKSEVHHLGTFKAFAPGGNESKRIVRRNLFQLARN